MDKLQTQVDMLQDRLDKLENGHTIPRNVETALGTRFLGGVQTGAAPANASQGAFPVSVPATPSGTLAVRFKGKIYNLLYS